MNQVIRIKRQQLAAYKAGEFWPTSHKRYTPSFRFIGNSEKFVKLQCERCLGNGNLLPGHRKCDVCGGAGVGKKVYRYRMPDMRIRKTISVPCPMHCGNDDLSAPYCVVCKGIGRLYVALK